MNLEESIVVLNVNLKESLVKKIISYIDFKAKKKMKIRGIGDDGTLDTNKRNVYGFSLTDESIAQKVFFRHVTDIIFTFLPNYNAKFKHNFARKVNQVDFLKYKPGGKYGIHIDSDLASPRTVSCIINLNENYEGGDFVFFNPINDEEMKRIKCKKGTIIFFPSNFLCPHAVQPITKGARYSIVSWIQ